MSDRLANLISCKALLVAVGLVLASSFAFAPASTSAFDVIDPGDACKNATNAAVCSGKDSGDGGSRPVSELIGDVTRIVAIIAGIAAVIMIIISGIKFAVSGGDSQKVAGARNTLLMSVIGLIVIALASGIISFIMSLI